MENIEQPRYSTISLESLIENYHKALSGENDFHLEPEALLINEQNLRIEEMNRLCAGCGLDGFIEWVNRHPNVKEFFSSDRLTSSPEAELRLLIDYRNDAAHGGLEVDEIFGIDELSELAEFAEILCTSVHKFFYIIL